MPTTENPTISTAQAAKLFGCSEDAIMDAYYNHKGHFEIDLDYLLQPVSNAGKPDYREKDIHPSRYQWTERGCFNFAMAIETDEAWQIYQNSVNNMVQLRNLVIDLNDQETSSTAPERSAHE